MKRLPVQTKNGKYYALVDDDDYERCAQYHWYAGVKRYRYAVGYISIHEQRVALHRFILKAPSGMQVDHINHDGRDNRKKNLRLCTVKENNRNARPGIRNKSGYKGVHLVKRSGNWCAQIFQNNRRTHLGMFKTAVDAAKAYDTAAKKYFGEFA